MSGWGAASWGASSWGAPAARRSVWDFIDEEDEPAPLWRTLEDSGAREQEITLARNRNTNQRELETARALGSDADGKTPQGFLQGAFRTLDAARSGVFNAGRELFDGEAGFDVDRFRERHDDRESFRDLEALEKDEDDGLLERFAKGTASFVGDVALDPLTYVSGGGSILGRQAAAKGVQAVARKGAGEVLEGASEAALRRTAANVGDRQLRQRLADVVPEGRLATASTDDLLSEAAGAGRLRGLAEEGFERRARELYDQRSNTGLRRWLDDDFGDQGRRFFDSLDSDLQGGLRVRVPFVRTTGQSGVRGPVALQLPGTGGGKALDAAGLGKLSDLNSYARQKMRNAPVSGWFARNANGRLGAERVAALNASYGVVDENNAWRYTDLVDAEGLLARTRDMDVAWDDQLSHRVKEALHGLRDTPAAKAADPGELDAEFKRLFHDRRLRDAVDPETASDATLAAASSADELHALLDDIGEQAVQLFDGDRAKAMGFIEEYTGGFSPRIRTDAEAARRLSRDRKGGGSNSVASREFYVGEYDDDGAVLRWMSPAEVAEKEGRQVFLDDPIEQVLEYAGMMRSKIRTERLVRYFEDSGLAVPANMLTVQKWDRQQASKVARLAMEEATRTRDELGRTSDPGVLRRLLAGGTAPEGAAAATGREFGWVDEGPDGWRAFREDGSEILPEGVPAGAAGDVDAGLADELARELAREGMDAPPASFGRDAAAEQAAGGLTEAQGELVRLARASGASEAHLAIHRAARGWDEPGSVADALDLDSVSQADIEAASRHLARQADERLAARGLPEEFDVWRAGDVPGDDVVNVSLSRGTGSFFAGGGEPTRYRVRRSDVLTDTDSAVPGGTFAESELQVPGSALRGSAFRSEAAARKALEADGPTQALRAADEATTLADLREAQKFQLANDMETLEHALQPANIPADADDYLAALTETVGRHLRDVEPFGGKVSDQGVAYKAWAKNQGMVDLGTTGGMREAAQQRIAELGLFGPEETAGLMADLFRKAQEPTTWGKFVDDFYAPFFTTQKALMTVGRGPGYVGRNVAGGLWNGNLVGANAGHWNAAAKMKVAESQAAAAGRKAAGSPAQKAAAAEARFEQVVRRRFGDDADLMLDAWRAFEAEGLGGAQRGSITRGQMSTWTQEGATGAPAGAGDDVMREFAPEGGRFERSMEAVRENPWISKIMRPAAEGSETFLRFGTFLRGVDRFGLDDGGVAAGLLTKASQFDYADLSEAEIKILKNIMPFYTWTRNNIPLQFRALVHEPGKVGRALRLNEELADIFAPEEGDDSVLPVWVRERLGWASRIPGSNGNQLALGMLWGEPLIDLNELVRNPAEADGLLGENGLINRRVAASNLNPLMKAAAEAASGRSFDTGVSFDTEEEAPGWARHLPFVSHTTPDGDRMANRGLTQAVRTIAPPVGQLERVLPGLLGNERLEDRRTSSLLSTFVGAPVSTLDPWQESAELYRQTQAIRDELEATVPDLQARREVWRALESNGWSSERARDEMGLGDLSPEGPGTLVAQEAADLSRFAQLEEALLSNGFSPADAAAAVRAEIEKLELRRWRAAEREAGRDPDAGAGGWGSGGWG